MQTSYSGAIASKITKLTTSKGIGSSVFFLGWPLKADDINKVNSVLNVSVSLNY